MPDKIRFIVLFPLIQPVIPREARGIFFLTTKTPRHQVFSFIRHCEPKAKQSSLFLDRHGFLRSLAMTNF